MGRRPGNLTFLTIVYCHQRAMCPHHIRFYREVAAVEGQAPAQEEVVRVSDRGETKIVLKPVYSQTSKVER